MKVIFVNGSNHLQGTTMAAIREMEKIFHDSKLYSFTYYIGEM